MIADILLAGAALGAGAYCLVLAQRLKQLSRLDNGMGGAIAVLSTQVDDMTRALEAARATAGESARMLDALTERSEQAARRLELLLASLHDLPETEDRSGPDQAGSQHRPRVLRRRRPHVVVAR